jgi:23S rRNA pseudouridine1911/1915/1917 synthase
MFERSFVVGPEHHKLRLDRFLEGAIPGLSIGRLKDSIRAGEVTVDGAPREAGLKLLEGNVVEVRMAEDPVLAMLPEPIPLEVLYEDDNLLVVDKPAFMLAHPTSTVHSGTLLNAATFHVNVGRVAGLVRPLLVHRLDRMTSGLITISKTRRAHVRLSAAWHDRRVTKLYTALLCGALADEAGVIDAPIGGSRDRHPGFAVDPEGRPARTRYAVVRAIGPFTLAELEPLTGRTNQIRIQAAHAGAPIAGDDLHGQPELARFRECAPEAPRCARLFLHASALDFPHPITGETVSVRAGLPAELRAFLDSAEAQYCGGGEERTGLV